MKVTECLYCSNKDLVSVTHRSDNVGIVRCARCGVMMVDSLSDDTEKLYTADYFEKQEATKNGYTNYLSSPAGNLVGKYAFSRLFARDQGVHLDLGCADGSLMEIFASEGFASHGLEISKDAVAIANAKGLDVQFSRLHGFPVNQPKSNIITAFDLLEHADKPGAVLKEVYNNLKTDGYFVFSTLSVKKNDPSDYWFNNSLEHYVYYNRENLAFILAEVFGEGNFAFVEEEINGIAEFWGFAKKGPVQHEKRLIDMIAAESFDPKDAEVGYLLSLFYSQAARVETSKKIIEHFKDTWTPVQTAEVTFFHYYFQGQLERALKEADTNKYLLPTSRSVYWQALMYAEAEFGHIRQQDIISEYNAEVLSLRSDLFKVRDELHSLKNSRVVGRIIKVRNIAGDSSRKALPLAKSLPRKGLHRTRRAVAKVLPPPLSRAIMRTLRGVKREVEGRKTKPTRTQVVVNKPWKVSVPLLSVVIPYYNRADTIDETLQSLAQQTYQDFEVIIVDDGSTDEVSVAKLGRIDIEVPQLQVIRQKNQGVATARNTGIKRARGKYIICLDSDDLLDATYIEKAVITLETSPGTALITSHQDMFGVVQELFRKSPYDPVHLYDDNMVITAAAFRKQAWIEAGGYKSNIGYEDWEFWLNLAEHGFWGKLIPEPLFKYRTSMQSRYVEDKDVHWNNIKAIKTLHPRYKSTVKQLLADRQAIRYTVRPEEAFLNLDDEAMYAQPVNGQPNVLIVIPWMTFGGAETLLHNYGLEIKDRFNLSFVTGLLSPNEWEYKFREVSSSIYHMPSLFDNEELYLEFISNYIKTRRVDVLHVVHNGFTFAMLPELRKRHKNLKIIVTMFNDYVGFFEDALLAAPYTDAYSSDNQKVITHFDKDAISSTPAVLVPNGIDCFSKFNPELYNRAEERATLGLKEDELGIFFVGRLSEEKNPDVFVSVAKKLLATKGSKRFKFFIIGDGPMAPVIEESIRNNDQDGLVHLGYQTDVPRYLSAADILVLPSATEGFPTLLLEAMAMNVAVVASDVGAVSSVIERGKNGFIVSPGSMSEIVEAITVLESDEALLRSFKGHSRELVEAKYSTRVLGNNYSKLYRSVLKEN